MSDNPPFFIIHDADHPVVEATILFSTLREQFTKFDIFFNDSISSDVDLKDSTVDDYVKQIDERFIQRLFFLTEKMPKSDLYYPYYGAFCGYLEEIPPEDEKEFLKLITTVYLTLIAIMRPQFDQGVLGMKNLGILDETARLTIKAAMDARKFVTK